MKLPAGIFRILIWSSCASKGKLGKLAKGDR